MTEQTIEIPQEQELSPIAKVLGSNVIDLPKDLYIPPDALEVFLDAFEGPLDFLLYLIKKQNLDILDIPVTKITEQYMDYIGLMQGMRFELAAEYLVMAAMLAEIKSRMLLPRVENEEGEEEDPRAELIRRLQEYERFKTVAEQISELPRMERDTQAATAEVPRLDIERPQPQVDLKDLLFALQEVMKRADFNQHHNVEMEPLSVRERMSKVLATLKENNFIEFKSLFTPEEGRQGVVVSFIAILELMKGGMIEIVQSQPFEPIHLSLARSKIVSS